MLLVRRSRALNRIDRDCDSERRAPGCVQLPMSEQQGLCSFYLPTHDHLKVKPAGPPWGRTSVPTNHRALLPPASTCARSFPRPLLKHRQRSLLQDEDIVFIAEKLREAMLEVCPLPHETHACALMCAWPAAHLPPMCGGCARRGSICVSCWAREESLSVLTWGR